MHIGFLNPQGNFDPGDSYWTEHPDFGGQLVYVKQVALALGEMGHRVDILTRKIVDDAWPPFGTDVDVYPGAPNVRIIRIPAGDDDRFLRKEHLWPYLGRDWVPNIAALYATDGSLPDAFTGHYGDGGLAAVLLRAVTGVPFTFTAHSLGAQKMDKMGAARRTWRIPRRAVPLRHPAGGGAVGDEPLRGQHHQHPSGASRAVRPPRLCRSGRGGRRRRFSVVPPGVNLAIFGSDAKAADEAADPSDGR